MAGFQPVTCSSKLTALLTFSRASQRDGPRASLSLTMPPVIRNVPMMHSQLGRWLKVRGLPFFPLNFSSFSAPKKDWAHHPGGERMRAGKLPNGDAQPFHFPDDHPSMPGWFKGMEVILRERGLWPEQGLAAQCTNFHCPPGRTNCCCRRLLFTQPDFESQKSQLQEYIEGRGHICDFYPKYHCELNFIEQYWGAAKFRYRAAPRPTTTANMERTVIESLDSVPLLQIRR